MTRLALHWQILIAVLLGALIGATLNATVSERTNEATVKGKTYRFHDSPDQIKIVAINKKDVPLEAWVVDPNPTPASRLDNLNPTDAPPFMASTLTLLSNPLGFGPIQSASSVVPGRSISKTHFFPNAKKLKEQKPDIYGAFHRYGRSTARWIGDLAGDLGSLFLRMLRMVAVPLIITSLITGVMSMGGAGGMGRMFSRTIAYYLLTSFFAVCTGLFLVNLIQPGQVSRGQDAKAEAQVGEAKDLGSVLFEQVETMIPPNPIEAAANTEFLSIIAFSLLFGFFAIRVGGEAAATLQNLFKAAFDVMMSMTLAIIHLAPLGVFLLLLDACATQGVGIFATLGWYMVTVFLGLLFHATVTLPLILHFVAKRNPWQYAQAMSPALLTAFSSASSNATLPLTLTSVEQRAGVPNKVGSFVLPLGATINMDGTALFEVIAVLFIAQLDPSVSLTFVDQIIVVITALLASVGAAGIPHAGLVMMVIVLQAVGLPTDRVYLILAVDRILDMFRTSVNVWSDSCGCAVIARFTNDEGSADTAGPSPDSPPAMQDAAAKQQSPVTPTE